MNNREKEKLFKKLMSSDNQGDIQVALSLYENDIKTAFRIMYKNKIPKLPSSLDNDVYINFIDYVYSLPINRIRRIDWKDVAGNIVIGILRSIQFGAVIVIIYLIFFYIGWWIFITIPALIAFYFIGKITKK